MAVVPEKPLPSRVAFAPDAIIGTNRGLNDAHQGEQGELPARPRTAFCVLGSPSRGH